MCQICGQIGCCDQSLNKHATKHLAAGDVRYGSTKRVAGAVGDGASSAALVYRRLTELGITI